jgi:hypothetical protein
MEKLFTSFGITTRNGQTKVRFGNDMVARIKIFAKEGYTVDFVELPNAMTKVDALVYAKSLPIYAKPEAKEIIDSKIDEKTKLAKAGEVKVQAKAPKAQTQTADKVTA